jgi:predicted nucleic acid-binding protein
VKPILADTGFIVALLDRSEEHHEQCRNLATEMMGSLITCEAVIAEACYLMRNIPGAAAAILGNVARGALEIPLKLSACAPSVAKLMRKYATVRMNLADACLVHLAEQSGTGRILTLDRDFLIYRWRRSRGFENLLDLGGANRQCVKARSNQMSES